MWSDLIELITPFYVQENMGYMDIDSDEIQILTIKKIPPFISEMSQVTEIQRFIKFSSWQTKNVLVKIKPLCLSISQNVHTE